MPAHADFGTAESLQESHNLNPRGTLAMLFLTLGLPAAFKPSAIPSRIAAFPVDRHPCSQALSATLDRRETSRFLKTAVACSQLYPGAPQQRGTVVMQLPGFTGVLPNSRATMTTALSEAVQACLSGRQSRMSVEFPLGFSFGVLGEAVEKGPEKKDKMRVIKAEDVRRSNRELGRLFVGMFEKTGLKPLVLFPSEEELTEAKKVWWDVLADEASVRALVPPSAQEAKAETAAAPIVSKAGFGAGLTPGGGKKGKGKSKKKKSVPGAVTPLNAIPESAEVVVAVGPGIEQLYMLKDFSERFGQEKLVILLNARLDAAGGAEGLAKPKELKEYFRDGGEGSFTTAFVFNTQPFGVAQAGSPEAQALAKLQERTVLYRKYPDEWMFCKKPLVGEPKVLMKKGAFEGRPSKDELLKVLEKQDEGLFGNIF